MEDFITVLVKIIAFLVILALACFIEGLLAMWVWNWIMPTIFGLSKITWLQGWGICFLGGLIFGHSTSTINNK